MLIADIEKEGGLSILLPQVERVAKLAGQFIAKERALFSLDRVEVKGEHDFVSYVDKTAEGMILPALRELLPEAGILSEEGGGESKPTGFNWVVDPLDGTTNFIHGMPPYAVSIGLSHGDDVVLGVVYEVTADELFSAVRGGGATMNGAPIRASRCARIDDALVATGFPYSNYEHIGPFFSTMEYFMRHSHGLRRLGSAATDLVYVACGRVDAFYEYGLHAWDVAAGIVIATEAGALCADFAGKGGMLHGGEMLCAAPGLFEEFSREIIRMMGRQDG